MPAYNNESSLDYISFYTNTVIKYMFKYIFMEEWPTEVLRLPRSAGSCSVAPGRWPSLGVGVSV